MTESREEKIILVRLLASDTEKQEKCRTSFAGWSLINLFAEADDFFIIAFTSGPLHVAVDHQVGVETYSGKMFSRM